MAAKTICPEDFLPTSETVVALLAWGGECGIVMGDQRLSADYIRSKARICEFVVYWRTEAAPGDRKKVNWQSTFRNRIKTQWKYDCRHWEKEREARHGSHQASSGDMFGKALNKLQDPGPIDHVVDNRVFVENNKKPKIEYSATILPEYKDMTSPKAAFDALRKLI